jgi:ADP-ribosylation factor-like protein 1
MGLSLSRIYQSVSSLAVWGKDKEVRILMVGLDSAGKTTILYRLQVSFPLKSLEPSAVRVSGSKKDPGADVYQIGEVVSTIPSTYLHLHLSTDRSWV